MDYVSTNNDYLINFRKIKYRNSAAQQVVEQNSRNREIEIERTRRRQIEARNASRSSVEVTKELSGMKNARPGKATNVRMTSHKASYAQRSDAYSLATAMSARRTSAISASPAASRNSAKTHSHINTKTAAEFLHYSCEERTYCDTESSGEKSRFPLSFFLSVIGVTILFVMLIGSYSQLSEATAIQSELEKEISSGLQYKAELEEKIDEKIDLAEIERIAVNRLGMVKADNSDKGYISIAGEDKIVVTEVDEVANENVSVVMSGVGRMFKNLVNKDS